jgi:N-methylhydantoinase B
MSAPPRSSPTRICPGSSPQVVGNVNAVYAITYSACFYVLRCLLGPDAPATAGLMYPVEVLAPQGSVVNAEPPAAVAGEMWKPRSERIVDVLLRALAQAAPRRVPAASYGTMSNLTISAGNSPAFRPGMKGEKFIRNL